MINLIPHRIAYLPIWPDPPGLTRIVVWKSLVHFAEEIGAHVPHLLGFNLSGLNIAPLIDRTRLDDGFFPLPAPRKRKLRMRLRQYRIVQTRILPGFRAIGRYLHFADRPCAGPS